MQQYLQVVTDYCSEENKTNDAKSVTNDELAMALGQIIRENLGGVYLHQLTDYAIKLLLLPHSQCSASITQELGCEFAKCIIYSYNKQNDTDSNEKFISKISAQIHKILDQLLQIFLTSNTNNSISSTDQSKLAQIISFIHYLFNDISVENVSILILKSNSFRSMAVLLYKNVICKMQEIAEKVRQQIITVTFHKQLSDLSTKIIQKYLLLSKQIQFVGEENKMEIINDLLKFTQIIFNDSRHVAIKWNVPIIQEIPPFISATLDNINVLTFDKLCDFFDIVYQEAMYYNNIYVENVNTFNIKQLQQITTKILFSYKLLIPFRIIWNDTHKQICDYNEDNALRFQIATMHKMMEIFNNILLFTSNNNENEDIISKIKESNLQRQVFVDQYFQIILNCSIINNMQCEILKWFVDKTQINGMNINENLWILWFPFLEKADIEHFDNLSQILQCLGITHRFLQLICNKLINNKDMYKKCRFGIFLFVTKGIIYFLEDEDGQNKPRHDIMQFCWDKILNVNQIEILNEFWVKTLISIILPLPHNYIKFTISNLLNVIKTNNNKYAVYVLLHVYIKHININNGEMSEFIFSHFLDICDSNHVLLYLWIEHYPWKYKQIQQNENIFVKIIKKCGSSLQKIANGNGECLKLQNGLNIFYLLLINKPILCSKIIPTVCKLLTKVINETLFFYDKEKLCMNVETYLSVLKVYGLIHCSIDMDLKTIFLTYTVQFLYLFSPMIEMDVCKYLLPNIKFQLSEIDKNDKNFAIQINCIFLLYQKCLLSNNESVVHETVIAIKESQKYLPFNVTVLIPNRLKTKICNLLK